MKSQCNVGEESMHVDTMLSPKNLGRGRLTWVRPSLNGHIRSCNLWPFLYRQFYVTLSLQSILPPTNQENKAKLNREDSFTSRPLSALWTTLFDFFSSLFFQIEKATLPLRPSIWRMNGSFCLLLFSSSVPGILLIFHLFLLDVNTNRIGFLLIDSLSM